MSHSRDPLPPPAVETAPRPQNGAISPVVRRVAALLDDRYTLPGTNVRFGLDAILGLVPGVGDVLGMLLGVTIVAEALRLGVRKRVVLHMAANLWLDATVGSVPLVGDAFDVFFKVHRRNLDLLERELAPKAA